MSLWPNTKKTKLHSFFTTISDMLFHDPLVLHMTAHDFLSAVLIANKDMFVDVLCQGENFYEVGLL